MSSFFEARSLILQHVRPLGTERRTLSEAAGRVLAEDIVASWDMPRWDNSAMDGFAVRAADCRKSGARLRQVGYIPAGGSAEGIHVAPGTAAKIMTGAPLPAGADAVVPFEQCADQGEEVEIRQAVKERDHIRFRAEDVPAGTVVIPQGTVLRPPEIGMIASFGKVLVSVYRRPRVAVLSTGDELVEPGEPVGEERIVNSNTFSLAAALQEIGVEPILLGIARDNRDSHLEKLGAGLTADALITSAGVSTGDRDLVREILAELGAEPVFRKIAIRPGSPTAFAHRGETPIFCLPGNPVATMITFEELVRPALLKMMGHNRTVKPFLPVRLLEEVRKKKGRLQFLRVRVEMEGGEYVAHLSGEQQTGFLRTMVRANALALLPEACDHVAAGETVQVHLLGPDAVMLEG